MLSRSRFSAKISATLLPILLTSLLIMLFTPTASQAVEYWWNGFGCADLSGMDNNVHAMTVYDGELVAGGMFEHIGATTMLRIARWNGVSWKPLGTGITGVVYTLTVFGDSLVAGGTFTQAGGGPASNIAVWDGEDWHALGDGFNSSVYTLAVHDDTLYAGGHFSASGASPIDHIAFWNGGEWTQVGDGLDDSVRDIRTWNDQLVAGGDFLASGFASTRHVATWDGVAWSGFDSGTAGKVNALAEYDGNLVVGGLFTSASDVLAHGLAQWDGAVWTPVGGGTVGEVLTLHVKDGLLYAGGSFTGMVGLFAHYIASWDGETWAALGLDDLDSDVVCINEYANQLAIGGRFSTGGGGPADHIALRSGGQWHELLAGGKGLDDDAVAMTHYQDKLVVAGRFEATAGWPGAHHVAAWDGEVWSHFGTGFDGDVLALAAHDDTLYAGGSFNIAGGVSASKIACWYDGSWHAMGSGLNQWCNDLCFYNGDLVAVGGFWVAGGVSASRVARWRAGEWLPFGAGLNTTANAALQYGDDLYVVGQFTLADATPASHIARWDGSAWQAMGDGLSGADNYFNYWDLCLYDDKLVLGGRFSAADGVTVNNLAVWDGANWATFGGGIPNTGVASQVFALCRYGTRLMVGGIFDTAGGVSASNIAEWDGESWSPLDDGISGGDPAALICLAGFDGSLYAGGDFSLAGNSESLYLARWFGDLTPVFLSEFEVDISPGRVMLNWRTGSPEGVAWFRLVRGQGETLEEVAWENAGPGLYQACDESPLLASGGLFEYQLFGRELDENWTLLRSESIEIGRTAEPAHLLGVFPNPFNPRGTLRLVVSETSRVRLTIHDASGRLVTTLCDSRLDEGVHNFVWQGRDSQGLSMASGVYFAHMETGGRTENKALVLLR